MATRVKDGYMDNHIHLIIVPEKEDSLKRVINEGHRLYSRMGLQVV